MAYIVYAITLIRWLSFGDTCQICIWFMEPNRYFCKIEYFAWGEIIGRSFSNLTQDAVRSVHKWYPLVGELCLDMMALYHKYSPMVIGGLQ